MSKVTDLNTHAVLLMFILVSFAVAAFLGRLCN